MQAVVARAVAARLLRHLSRRGADLKITARHAGASSAPHRAMIFEDPTGVASSSLAVRCSVQRPSAGVVHSYCGHATVTLGTSASPRSVPGPAVRPATAAPNRRRRDRASKHAAW